MTIAALNETGAAFLKWILTTSWQATIFFLLIGALAFIFRKKSPAFLSLLWTLALIRFILPPVIPLPASILNSAIPEIVNPIQIIQFEISPVETQLVNPELNVSAVIFLIWLVGVLGLFSVLLIRSLKFSRTLKHATPFPPNQETGRPKAGRVKYNIFTLSEFGVPLTVGFFRPKIYLPVEAKDWSQAEFKFVLQHETAHIHRGDLLVIKLQALIQILYFFHPVIWILNFLINYYRELACDDISISKSGGQTVEYSKTLLKNLARLQNHRLTCLPTSSFGKSKILIKKRFKHILAKKEDVMLKLTNWQKAFITGLAVLAVVISIGGNTIAKNKSAANDTTKKATAALIAYDVAPKPIGGFKAIHENLIYPESARKAGLEGRVFIKVLINEKGIVEKTEVIKTAADNTLSSLNSIATKFRIGKISEDEFDQEIKDIKAKLIKIKNGELKFAETEMDKAAADAVKKTKWEPALVREKPVKVWISIPVIFKLDHKKTK